MKRLKVTLVSYMEVSEEDLEAYEAKTIQEAAENCRRWVEDGDMSLGEMTEDVSSFVIEGLEDGED